MARNTVEVVSDKAVSSCSGSGPSYTVNYSAKVTWDPGDAGPPAIPVQVGDNVTAYKMAAGDGAHGDGGTDVSTYTYLVTGITDGDTLTLKYITDSNGDGDDSPCDLPSGTGSSASPNKAPHDFTRDLGPAFNLFL